MSVHVYDGISPIVILILFHQFVCADAQQSLPSPRARPALGWAGLGWSWLEQVGLGWAGLAGLGWAGLGWAGAGLAGTGWDRLGWTRLVLVGAGWARTGWADWAWLAWLVWAGLASEAACEKVIFWKSVINDRFYKVFWASGF